MKSYKDLAACITCLQVIQRRNDMKPEQRRNIKKALHALEVLRRNDQLTRPQAFRYVREVTEALTETFLKR